MRALLLPLLLGTAFTPLSAAELDFYKDVYPFLKSNCISCHNKTTTKADLNMETPELMIKGGESGPAIVPGKSGESLLVQASLHAKDMEMPPPNNKSGAVNLTPAEIAVLKLWIDQGAKSSVQQEHSVAWQPLAAGVHPIYTVAMTRDGRYAACGRSNRIFVYDLATRQLVAEVTDPKEKSGGAHRALVQSLAFSPDGMRMASGSFREVKIWKRESTPSAAASATVLKKPDETMLKKLAASSKSALVASALSADGKLAAAACADGAVRVWDVATMKQVAELRGSLAEAQKASQLEWGVAAQALEQTFQKSEIARIEAQDKALDELLKKANDAIVTMTKVLPEKQKALKPASEAKAAAKKTVDDLAAKTAGGKTDAAAAKQLKDAQEKLQSAAMAEVSATSAVSAAESNIKDAQDDVKRITESKAKNARDIAAANAAIDKAKKLQEQDTADLAALKQSVAKASAKAAAVSFSADSQRVAALFEDNHMVVWAVASGMPVDEAGAEALAATTLAPAADGSFAATKSVSMSTRGPPRWVLERTLGTTTQHSLFTDRVNAVKFSPDGKLLATGSGDSSRSGDVMVFDTATGKAVKTWKDRHNDAVLCLDFSPDGRLLASGGADKMARVVEVQSGRQVNTFEGHTHHVMGVAFRADGRVLATAGADGVVMTWDMLTGERRKKIEGWTKEVTSLQFIGATNQIVTSAGDNLVRIVNDEGTEIRAISKLPDYMQAAASTANGATIVGGGEDSFLRVWDGSNGKELASFGAR